MPSLSDFPGTFSQQSPHIQNPQGKKSMGVWVILFSFGNPLYQAKCCAGCCRNLSAKWTIFSHCSGCLTVVVCPSGSFRMSFRPSGSFVRRSSVRPVIWFGPSSGSAHIHPYQFIFFSFSCLIMIYYYNPCIIRRRWTAYRIHSSRTTTSTRLLTNKG